MPTYAPSANKEPWARLICSITPTISIKPSAISANNSPSVRPLMRCGRRSTTVRSTVHTRRGRRAGIREKGLTARSGVDCGHLLEGNELALGLGVRVLRILGARPRDDLVMIRVVGRLFVAASEVDRLLDLVRRRIHVGVVVLHPVGRGHFQVFQLLD